MIKNISSAAPSTSLPLTHEKEWADIFPNTALTPNYFASYSEPLRRYPSSVYFPRFVMHFATSCENAGFFEKWLEYIFLNPQFAWRRRSPTFYTAGENTDSPSDTLPYKISQFDKPFFKNFSKYIETSQSKDFSQKSSNKKSTNDDTIPRPETYDEVLFFEAIPPDSGNMPIEKDDKLRILIRVEVHQSYFTLSIFVPLIARPTNFLAKCGDVDFIRINNESCKSNILLADLYERLPVEITKSESLGQTGEAIKLLIQELGKLKGKTFVNFRGIFAPAHLVGGANSTWSHDPAAKNDTCNPIFLSPYHSSFEKPTNIGNTTRYLTSIWDTLIKTVFQTRFTDVIGCYMARGQMIYLSNLGAQRYSKSDSRDQRDALRFLVIYKGSDLPADVEPESNTTNTKIASNDIDDIQRWALGRLLHRLLTMGTLRLLAMRNLPELLEVDRRLLPIERRLVANPDAGTLAGISDDVSKLMSGKDIFGETKRVDNAYQSMNRLLSDLGIVPIPGWQPYDMFVRRRLDSTYDRIVGLGERYERIWQIYRARQQEQEAMQQGLLAATSLKTQNLANIIAMFGVIAVIDQVVTTQILIDFARFTSKILYIELLLLTDNLELQLPKLVEWVGNSNHDSVYRLVIDAVVGWSTFIWLKKVIQRKEEPAKKGKRGRGKDHNWGRDPS